MATDRQTNLQGRLADTEKAVRRGKKLEKTLLKIIAQSEPASGAEEFLKSVRLGVKTLKKDAKAIEQALSPTKKKARRAEQTPSRSDTSADGPKPPVKRSRRKRVDGEALPEASAPEA
ncbi:hypothetical protein [Microvirga pakistanensis]|uniref:hypothetical protein n=1 Tax=Microvirga pakistanensis TaxID=1682650 RepID=UPI0010695D28|nr:hypothetical protein [Microvirga pakistanensis]